MNALALSWKERVALAIRSVIEHPQVPCPLKHHFAPGVYIREIFMPAGSYVLGKIHRTEHFNILQKGSCMVYGPGHEPMLLKAPMTFVSKAGVQKVLHILEDTVWSTVHLTEERDLERLEAALIEPDDSYPKLDRTTERLAIEDASRVAA